MSVSGIEPLESLDAGWSWGDFFIGVGAAVGVADAVEVGVAVASRSLGARRVPKV